MNRNPISVDLSLLGVCLLIIKIWMGWFKAIVREPSNMAGVVLWDVVFVIMFFGTAFFFIVLVHDILKWTEERKRGI